MTDEELEQTPLVRMAKQASMGAVSSGDEPMQRLLADLLTAFCKYHIKVLEVRLPSRN